SGCPLLCSFFHCSCDPVDLHSFPTRRSSDLDPGACRMRLARVYGKLTLGRKLEELKPGSLLICEALDEASLADQQAAGLQLLELDRKSTRLNSSHVKISYAGFCLKKKRIYKA